MELPQYTPAAPAGSELDLPPLVADEREVSLLFADMRNSSALTAALEPHPVYELLGQVIDLLTAAVIEHDGFVVDYYGDGLCAMWNAPDGAADHAERACGAAVRMLETLPAVAAAWADAVPAELRLGIGVHTGVVQVGNAGSTRRTKYGPRGPNVHLASRTESAAKLLDVPLLLTEATASQLSRRFSVYRVCRAELPGIHHPVQLFGLCASAADAAARAAIEAYERALCLFEEGRMEEAAAQLAKIDATPQAVPAGFLAREVEHELRRRQRRRSTDKASRRTDGVITLHVK